MSVTSNLSGWRTRLYHESGLHSLRTAGRDAWLIILARSLRMFSYGAASLFLALFFAELQFSDYRIGIFMSLTLLGDVALTLGLTSTADRIGRRRTIILGSILMVISGGTFVLSENFWILLVAAVVGVISASGGDFGPFRAIEESMVSQITSSTARSDVLSWYVTAASFGSAVGTEMAGRMVDGWISATGRSKLEAYHLVFLLYVIMGFLNIGAVLLMSDKVESESPNAEAGQYELVSSELEEGDREVEGETSAMDVTEDGKPAQEKSNGWLGLVSPATRSVMFKLWPLLAVDSTADGMVNYSLTNYYLEQKFHTSSATLGDIASVSYFLSAASTIFAGPLARHLGLINTMVFTHIPSSAAVALFPLPPSLGWTIFLFFIRTGLNNMDQAPRAAFIAAVVKPEERTAIMGITSTVRTLAATAGPSITGVLSGNDRFWMAFAVAGGFRLAYDFGLWALFKHIDVE